MITVRLRGITWDHTRGYVPMVATAQRFHEQHPDVEVAWDKRSLQQFADYPLDRLIDDYDLLVIDHPWTGEAARNGWLIPLDAYLSGAFLDQLAADAIGNSHASYQLEGHQWALAIDAATPVSAHRPDLMKRWELSVPHEWSQLLDLARKGVVVMPAKAVDLLGHLVMVLEATGTPLFQDGRVATEDAGGAALESIRELVALCPREVLGWNPIRVYEALSGLDEYAYSPFGYGYANYSVNGYSRAFLVFGDLVTRNRHPLRSMLGGAGLAVSARSTQVQAATEYAEFVGSISTQSTIYATSGGQPGVRTAWLDVDLNRMTHDYFRNTLPVLERAYVRPRYSGYLTFQDNAADIVHEYVEKGGNSLKVFRTLNELYQKTLDGDFQ